MAPDTPGPTTTSPRPGEFRVHLYLATTDRRPPAVRTDLAVHLAGRHEARAVLIARTILLTMPSARVRIAHPQPAYEAYTAWSAAADQADALFAGVETGTIPEPESQVSGHVRLNDPVRPAAVNALTGAASPTGAPQLRVSLGGLLTVVTDLPAFTDQLNLWATAYKHAASHWSNLPAVEDLAAGALPHFEDFAGPAIAKAAA